MSALRRLRPLVRSASQLLRQQTRSIAGSTIEEIEATRTTARRAKLQEFLRLSLSAPTDARVLGKCERSLRAHSSDGVYRNLAQLHTAIAEAEPAVASFRTAALHLSATEALTEVHQATAKPTPDADDGEDRALRLPHRTDNKAAANPQAGVREPASSVAEAKVPVERKAQVDVSTKGSPNPPESTADTSSGMKALAATLPPPLTAEELETLSSLRVSAALAHLPTLWPELAKTDVWDGGTEDSIANGSAVPRFSQALHVSTAISAIHAMSQGGLERLQMFLELSKGQQNTSSSGDASYSPSDLERAVTHTLAIAVPLLLQLLERTAALSPEEAARVSRIRSSSNAEANVRIFLNELRRVPLLSRFRVGFGRLGSEAGVSKTDSADGDALSTSDRDARQVVGMLNAESKKDARNAKLYSSIVAEGELHAELARALFAYHDRNQTRLERVKTAARGAGLFVLLNILDFVLSNL